MDVQCNINMQMMTTIMLEALAIQRIPDRIIIEHIVSIFSVVCVAGCLERSHCWKPLVVGTAYDNASIVVTFTSPPANFAYEAYNVYLKQGSLSYSKNVSIEVSKVY